MKHTKPTNWFHKLILKISIKLDDMGMSFEKPKFNILKIKNKITYKASSVINFVDDVIEERIEREPFTYTNKELTGYIGLLKKEIKLLKIFIVILFVAQIFMGLFMLFR